MGEKDSVDETEVSAEIGGNEAKQGHSSNLDEYDPSLDIPIALGKGTWCYMKHPNFNYVSYDSVYLYSLEPWLYRDTEQYHIALKCPKWKTVVMEEVRVLEKNKTWEICALPKRHKIVGCKWLFTLKYKVDETLDRHKVRLVAKGFTQTYDVDYSKTFSLLSKLIIRVMYLLMWTKTGLYIS